MKKARTTEKLGFARKAIVNCPVADDLFDRMVSVNLIQWYSERDGRHVAAGINKVLSVCLHEGWHKRVDLSVAP